jgi:hypothetical protein
VGSGSDAHQELEPGFEQHDSCAQRYHGVAVNSLSAAAIACLALIPCACAQFVDNFDGPAIQDWYTKTGDGFATMEFRQADGYGSILVDATHDKRGIWWAYVRRNVAPALDLKRLHEPGHELRIETRIRVSHAPRRVNLHLNTQKTTDFLSHLMEYDIPDTDWHTISMTTHGFKAGPGDTVNAQLALIDWGLSRYRVDVDYYKVDVVDAAKVRPDVGNPIPYRPPNPPPESFSQSVPVAADSMIDLTYPDVNFDDWKTNDSGGSAPVMTVSGTEWPIMRFDLTRYKDRKPAGQGLLVLTTRSVEVKANEEKDFGMVRVSEILGGDPAWDQRTVTLERLCEGHPLEDVINTQMIIDVYVAPRDGGKTLVTISKPVLERLLSGRTKGISVKPLGAITAAFYSMEYKNGERGARLYFNLE